MSTLDLRGQTLGLFANPSQNLQNNVNLQLSDRDLHFKCARTSEADSPSAQDLGAAAGGAAFHAAVAGAVAGHDGSAGGAGGAVSHVVHGLHGGGGVEDAAVLHF